MEKEKFNVGLFFATLFLGWLGIDKFIAKMNFKQAWKMACVKLLANFVFIGIVWNIIDLIMICCGRYEFDPRDYLTLIEEHTRAKKNNR